MAIVAPYSKHKKGNLKIFVVILIAVSVWFIYDGYYNKNFIEKHTDENGNPNSTLVFNQKSPPYIIGLAVLLGIKLAMIAGKKITADEKGLSDGKKTVSYDSIEKINKTSFEKDGHFTITYKADGQEKDWTLSGRKYNNLKAVLDEIVSKIS